MAVLRTVNNGVVSVGIVGAGFGCAVHLPAFDTLRGEARVVALADCGSGRADAVNCDRTDKLAIFNDGCDLADSETVDAVSVAVPPNAQPAVVRTALEHGKSVLCEKPFGPNLDVAERLAEQAGTLGVATAIGFEFRYDPWLGALIDAAAEGRVGRVRQVAVDWLTAGALRGGREWSWRDDSARGGGVLNEFCAHVFDYAPLIAGGRITRVCCRCVTVVRERPAVDGMNEVHAPDYCDVLCEFEGGATGRFSVSNAVCAPLGHRVEVLGEAGTLTFHHAPPFTRETVRLEYRDETGTVHPLAPRRLPRGADGDVRQDAFRALAADFIASIRGVAPARLPRFGEGLAVRRVIAACEKSTRTGRRADVVCA